MVKKSAILIFLYSLIALTLVGCGTSNQSLDKANLTIADFYGDYTFDEVVYMHKHSGQSDEEYENDLKAVTDMFTDAEFTIKEGYFYESTGTFGEGPFEGFEFITLKEYDDKFYDDLDEEELEHYVSLSSVYDYDDIKKELDVNEIEHYIMYEEGGILLNPFFYITKDDVFVAMETITDGETEDSIQGITHYLLKLEEN